MATPMMWAYFAGISNHMWDDPMMGPRYQYYPPQYQENNNIDFDMWDELVQFLVERQYNTFVIDVGDGVRFESHPEICAPDAITIEFLRKKLDELRAVGITPVPKLNFSTCHHTWLKDYSHMVGSMKYLEVAQDLIRETCQIFDHPSLFHLGMDEEDDIGCHRFRSMVVFRKENVLWRDFYRLFDICEENDARPWVWSDYYWANKDAFIRHMPKSVLQSNWFYYKMWTDRMEPNHATAVHTFNDLEELGYDQVPTCSTWNNNYNPKQVVAHCQKYIANPVGFMTAPWTHIHRDEEYTLKNDAHRLYLARKQYYPETLK